MKPRNVIAITFLQAAMMLPQAVFGQQSANPATAAKDSLQAPLSDSALNALNINAATGRAIFTGDAQLTHGGPSCISCHNVTAADLPPGGLLAKDLTHVYGRLGEAGLPPILSSTPFPAMASAYRNKPLTPEEVTALTAFFQKVEREVPAAEPTADHSMLLVGGSVGATIWFGLIGIIWANRKRKSVKHDIYKRQIH